MFVLLAVALGLIWVLCVLVLQVTAGAVHLFLVMALAAIVGHFHYRRLLQRRLFAAHRSHTGPRGTPPLTLRSGNGGKGYIVS